MQLSKPQITELLTEMANEEGESLQTILKICFEAIMQSERKEYVQDQPDKGNGFRHVRAYGQGKLLELRVPRTRSGNFYPLLLSVIKDQEEESRKLAFELYGAGLTTEQVGEMFDKVYGRHYSKASVSRMFSYAREEVKYWLERDLDEYYPIIYIDATFWSTRRAESVSKEAYYTVLGVKSDRTREVLAILNFPTESSTGWEEMLRNLVKRGVKSIDLIVADGLSGLEEATARVFSGTPFQKCVVHLERNIMSRIKPTDKEAVGNDLGEVFDTEGKHDSPQKGWERFEGMIEKWKKKYPSLKVYLDKVTYFSHFTYLGYHRKVRRMIYTTNWIERLNRDYKRTLRMRGVMPDAESVILLMGHVAMTKKAYERKVPGLDCEQKKFQWNLPITTTGLGTN